MTAENRKATLARYVDGWAAQAIAESLGVSLAEVEAVLPGGAGSTPAAPAAASAPRPAAPSAAPAEPPPEPDRNTRVYDDNSVSVRLPHVRVGL